ncbi:MAG: thiamine diphosphokinase [Clostridiales bacterium]|nr:thiamine diphosphokinase [Clostridiales bacterium]
MSKILIIAGGPGIDPSFVKSAATISDLVICADSGADIALAAGLIPDMVFGDLDSISSDGINVMKAHNVPVSVFPVEKDMTDSELCLSYALNECEASEIFFISSFTGRTDQLLSNIQLAVKHSSYNTDIILTDGRTSVYPLLPDMKRELKVQCNDIISIIPVSDIVRGVTTENLYYELKDADISYGSSFTVSNKPLSRDKDSDISVSIREGSACIVLSHTYD